MSNILSNNTIIMNAHIWPSFSSYSLSKEFSTVMAESTESLKSDQEERVPSRYKCIDRYWRNLEPRKEPRSCLLGCIRILNFNIKSCNIHLKQEKLPGKFYAWASTLYAWVCILFLEDQYQRNGWNENLGTISIVFDLIFTQKSLWLGRF